MNLPVSLSDLESVTGKFGKLTPNENSPGHDTYIVVVNGQDTEYHMCNENGDDMTLEYTVDGEEHECVITSKPLLWKGNHIYFTRHGFLGTMAINRDTLLNGDVYHPSKGEHEQATRQDIIESSAYDEDNYYYDSNDKAYIDDEHSQPLLKSGTQGQVTSLHGSKKTLNEQNKAKRMRKLLEPQGISFHEILLYASAGFGVALTLIQMGYL